MSIVTRFARLSFVCCFGFAFPVATGLAHAQSAVANFASDSAGWSSSQTGSPQLAEDAVPVGLAALPSAPAPASSAQDQSQNDSNTYSGWGRHDIVHRLTFEGGFGASAPAGDKADITWGYGFTIGGGVNINRSLAMLVEYQFLNNKVPGAIISQSGATGGHYHIWSFTVDPVYDIWPKNNNDLYIVGGGGFYHKTTNFSDLTQSEECYSFYYCGQGYTPQTVGSLSSNQGGFNIGGGYQHRFGGMYGEGHTRFFAEVRFLDVLSPALQGTSPSGGLNPVTVDAGTKLLPITFGVRW